MHELVVGSIEGGLLNYSRGSKLLIFLILEVFGEKEHVTDVEGSSVRCRE